MKILYSSLDVVSTVGEHLHDYKEGAQQDLSVFHPLHTQLYFSCMLKTSTNQCAEKKKTIHSQQLIFISLLHQSNYTDFYKLTALTLQIYTYLLHVISASIYVDSVLC